MPVDRSEVAHQLRISLVEVLTHGVARCADCSRRCALEDLEIDHVGGRTWYGRHLNFLDRIRRQWSEHDRGVRLRALCRTCNASHGATLRYRSRYR